MTHTHLITGASGQDGIWLTRHLLGRGQRVVAGVSANTDPGRLGYLAGAEVRPLDVRDASAVRALVTETEADVVHNLAALSSVGDSWDGPDLVDEINRAAVEDLVTVLADCPREVTLVHASSAEVFGPVAGGVVDEDTPLAPVSPYGIAKAAAHRAVAAARADGLRSTNLILFGHTSPLHAARFAIPTLVRQAAEVGLGSRDKLALRDPTTTRDWGSAADYVRAFALAAEGPAGDYVIATGRLHALAELGAWALAAAGVDDHEVTTSGAPARPGDFDRVLADPTRAATTLGWRSTIPLDSEVRRMVRVEQTRLTTGVLHDPAYLEDIG